MSSPKKTGGRTVGASDEVQNLCDLSDEKVGNETKCDFCGTALTVPGYKKHRSTNVCGWKTGGKTKWQEKAGNLECKLCGYKTDRKNNLIQHQTNSEGIQQENWCKRSRLLPIETGQEMVEPMGDNEIKYFISPKSIKFEDSIHIADDDDDDIELQTAQSGFENQPFTEEKYSPSVEKQQDSDVANRSNGDLCGESLPEPPSNDEPQKAKKFARTFAKFVESQILETPANKRHKLTSDIIQVISKYIEDE